MKRKIVSLVLIVAIALTSVMIITPVSAEILPEANTISLGKDHNAAIKNDGTLWTWGNNHYGQLGNGTTDNSSIPIKIMDDVVSVSLGNNHSAAIKSDGSLWTWGGNYNGQLGNGTTDNSSIPIKIMDDAVVVSLGANHSAAIKSDGSLWMWGYMYVYHSFGSYAEWVEVYNPIKIMDDVVSVSLGEGHSAAIKSDGSLWTWGDNMYGQLGYGSQKNMPFPGKLMDDVMSVSLGDDYCAAIKTDGSLWTWGLNNYGQLGNGTTDISYTPIKIMDNVASVSLGADQSAAIKSDGSLWTWGDNEYGQPEDGTTEDSYMPIKIMDNAALVSLGSRHSAAIKSDGSLWTWGHNDYGQLGNGTAGGSYAIVPVKIMDNVKLPSTANIVTIPTTPSEWAEYEINQAISLGLIPEELQADYQTPITRLDFCKLALTLYKKITGKTGIIGISNKFNDLSGLSSDDSFTIDVVSDLGIVNGYEDGTFRPYNAISRQEAAVMLMRTAKVLGLGEFIDNYANVYDDCGDIAEWAMEGIKYVCNASIMNGSNSWIETNPDGYTTKANHITFSPYDNYTREQAMVTYYRLYNKLITSNNSSADDNNYEPSQVPTSVEVQDLSNIAYTFNFSVSQYIEALKSVDVSNEDDTKASKKQEALNKVKTVNFNAKMMPQYTRIKNLGIADELETVFYDALFDFYMSYSLKEKGKKYYDDIQPSDFSDGGLSAESKIIQNTGEFIADILEDKTITNTYVAGKNTYEVTIEMPIGGIGFINAKFVDKKSGAEYTYNGTQGDNSGIQTAYSYMQNYVDELIELYKKANINVAQTAINEIIEIFDSVSFTNSKKISKIDFGEQTAQKLKEMGLGEVDEFIGYCVEVHNLVKDWKNLTDSMKKEDVYDVYEKAQKVYNNMNSSFGNSISGNLKKGSVEFVNSLQETVYEKLGELIEYCKVYIETH